MRRSAAYNSVFQDWLGWLKEGIIDINIPMIYGPNHGRDYAETYAGWCSFVKKHRYGRHVVISPALYLNTLEGSLAQLRTALFEGARPDGMALYSYANFSKDNIPREELVNALTLAPQNRVHDPAFFPGRVPTPEMPWKSKPTKGHIKGFIYDEHSKSLDGASVEIKGPTSRTLKSDATGFYGAVYLDPGEYSITAKWGEKSVTKSVRISAGRVSTINIALK